MPVMFVPLDLDQPNQRSVMTAVGDVTMKRPHFRLKINLSKFFHDVRRFCWIFIDETKIHKVIHIKRHISELFNIVEPFHLLLNDTEYLPPIEDVRILRDNETILVVPGSGINNEAPTIIETSNRSNCCPPSIIETNNESICDKAQAINIKAGKSEIVQNVSNDTLNNIPQTPIGNITRDMTFYSVISDTVDNGEGDTDSKSMHNSLEDCNMIDSVASIKKRKRVRKRKSKNQSWVDVSSPIAEGVELKIPKKPKIIESYIISPVKHTRFDSLGNDEDNIAKQIVQEKSREEFYLSKASSPKDLSMLLALGQSSTPITFVNKKLKKAIKTEKVLSDEKNKNLHKIMENSMEKNLSNKEFKEENSQKLQVDFDKILIMTRKPKVQDIIAFKTLKMDADYTPQVSKYVVGKVVDSNTQSDNYTFRILYGKQEVQVPFGKFSLSEEESENHLDEDTFVFNYSQMLEPRLISP